MIRRSQPTAGDLRAQETAIDAEIARHKAASQAAREARRQVAADPEAYEAEVAREQEAEAQIGKLEARRVDLRNLIAEADERERSTRLDRVEERARGNAAQCARHASKAHKLLAAALPELSALEASAAALKADNEELRAGGREPIESGEVATRSVPGRIEPARYEERVVWRKWKDGPEVAVYRQTADGETVPAEAGAVRSIERVCVEPERHVAPIRAKPLAETVVIPAFRAGEAPLWPVTGAR